MAEKSPAQHLAQTILEDAGLGSYENTLFFNTAPDEKPSDTPIAVCYDSGGFDPTRHSDGALYYPTVQIIVYGAIEDKQTARDLMENIRTYLVETMPQITVENTIYYGGYQQGDIFSLGDDENKRPQLSANFRLYRRAA